MRAILLGAADRQLYKHNELAWLAWHVAALGRTKKLPKIDKLMAKPATSKRQTWQEQMAVMDMWAAHTAKVARQKKRLKR